MFCRQLQRQGQRRNSLRHKPHSDPDRLRAVESGQLLRHERSTRDHRRVRVRRRKSGDPMENGKKEMDSVVRTHPFDLRRLQRLGVRQVERKPHPR